MRIYKNILPAFCIILGSIFIFSCNNANKETSVTEISDTTTKTDTAVHDMNNMPDTMTVPVISGAAAVINGTYSDTIVNGTATFETTADGKIKMVLIVTVPVKANKSVAVHLHEHGDCSDNGNASHGHWNPTNAQHGKWGSASFHSGDIGNVKLDAKGNGTITITTDKWTLGGKAGRNILRKAIIIHSGVDDYTTQPTGDAGGRIGCGLIAPK